MDTWALKNWTFGLFWLAQEEIMFCNSYLMNAKSFINKKKSMDCDTFYRFKDTLTLWILSLGFTLGHFWPNSVILFGHTWASKFFDEVSWQLSSSTFFHIEEVSQKVFMIWSSASSSPYCLDWTIKKRLKVAAHHLK